MSAFFLPTSSGERIGLTITLFLAQTVNLMLFAEYLPPGGDTIPLVAQYLVLSTMLTAFSVLYSVYTTRKEATDSEPEKSDMSEAEVTASVVKERQSTPQQYLPHDDAARFRFLRHSATVAPQSTANEVGAPDIAILKANREESESSLISTVLQKKRVECGWTDKTRDDFVGVLFMLVVIISTVVYTTLLYTD